MTIRQSLYLLKLDFVCPVVRLSHLLPELGIKSSLVCLAICKADANSACMLL